MLVGGLMYQYSELGSTSLFKTIDTADPTTNLARILTAFLLHLQVLPEVQSALGMMAFIKRHPTAFRGKRFEYPMVFCAMKVLGGYASMVANIFVILHQPDIENVVKDYIAVNVIAQISQLMAGTVTDLNVEEFLKEHEIWLNTDRDTLSD